MSSARDPVAIVDVGSNSVRSAYFLALLIRRFICIIKKVLCRLGAGFTDSGRLNPEGRIRVMEALQTFAAVIADMACAWLQGCHCCGARGQGRRGIR